MCLLLLLLLFFLSLFLNYSANQFCIKRTVNYFLAPRLICYPVPFLFDETKPMDFMIVFTTERQFHCVSVYIMDTVSKPSGSTFNEL